MTHYILIDADSGYVWGETDAADPVEACRAVDHEIDPSVAREYVEHGAGWRFNGASGYLVYEAPADWVPVENGQDAAEIARVDALPHVANIAIRDIPE